MAKYLFFLFIFTQTVYALENKKSSIIYSVDQSEEYLSEKILTSAEKLDKFLGGEDPTKQVINRSKVKFYYLQRKEEGKNFYSEFGYKIYLSLPRVQNHFKLLIEQKSNNQLEDNASEAEQEISSSSDNESELSAALRYFVNFNKWKFKLDTGVKVAIPIKAFSRLNIKREFNYIKWKILFLEQVYLDFLDGIGETARLNFSYPISKKISFTFGNYSTWTDSSDIFSNGHYLSIKHKLSPRREIRYQGGIAGNPQSQYIDIYYFHISYKQLMYKKWLFFSLSSIVEMEKDNNFIAVPSISFKIESIFGQNN